MVNEGEVSESTRKFRQPVATEQQFAHVGHTRWQTDRLQLVAGQVEMSQTIDSRERVRVFDPLQLAVGEIQMLERSTEPKEGRFRDAGDLVAGRRQSAQVEHGHEQSGRQVRDDVVVEVQLIELGQNLQRDELIRRQLVVPQ